jgi:hypothetical protein
MEILSCKKRTVVFWLGLGTINLLYSLRFELRKWGRSEVVELAKTLNIKTAKLLT